MCSPEYMPVKQFVFGTRYSNMARHGNAIWVNVKIAKLLLSFPGRQSQQVAIFTFTQIALPSLAILLYLVPGSHAWSHAVWLSTKLAPNVCM